MIGMCWDVGQDNTERAKVLDTARHELAALLRQAAEKAVEVSFYADGRPGDILFNYMADRMEDNEQRLSAENRS